jgi:hypothetical protein
LLGYTIILITEEGDFYVVRAPNVNSLTLDNSMLRIVTAVQQFMTEFNGAVSEQEKIVVITNLS